MKFIVNTILFLCIAVGATAQDLESIGLAKDRTHFQLRAKPVTVITKTLKPPKDSMVLLSDAPLATGPAWTVIKEEQLKFDSLSGMLQQQNVKELQKKKETSRTTSYWYKQPEARVMAQSSYADNRLEDSAVLKYNRSGLLLQYISYNNKAQMAFRVTYTYDRKKQLTIIRKLNEDDFPVAMIKYKYSSTGLLTETQHFDKNFRQVASKKYSIKREKDGSVNLSAATYNDLNALQEGYTQVKDTAGHVLEESQVDKDRHISEYHGYEYNVQGDPVAEKTISATIEQHLVYRYRYDEQKNWISREIYNNEQLQSVEERSISY